MDLHEFGEYMLERAEMPIVGFTLKCLGFTAIALETLLDEVSDSDAAMARWGIEDEEKASNE